MAAFALWRSRSPALSRGVDRPAPRSLDRVSSREGATSAGSQVSGAVRGSDDKPEDSCREYAGVRERFQRRAGGPLGGGRVRRGGGAGGGVFPRERGRGGGAGGGALWPPPPAPQTARRVKR